MGMREMQERVYEARDAQYLLLKAPPASGKSRALMFLGLDKLYNQGLKKVCVNFDVNDSEGNRHSPREWFIVPFDTINVAIDLMLNGEAANYQYDAELRQIVSKET